MGRHSHGGDQQGYRQQKEGQVGPPIIPIKNVFKASPGREANQNQQYNQECTLGRDSFFAFSSIEGNQAEQQFLKLVRTADRQRETCIRIS